jgi:hypothetical protein
VNLSVAPEETAYHPSARTAAPVTDAGDAHGFPCLDQLARTDGREAVGTAEDVQIIARQHHHLTRVDLPGRTILKGESKRTFRHIMETNDLGGLNHKGARPCRKSTMAR